MSAVLRVWGRGFDVDQFLKRNPFRVSAVHRRGEPVLKTKPRGKKRSHSGISIIVSNASFHSFDIQIRDAIRFLGRHRRPLKRLVGLAGVDDATLDFGVAWRDVAAQSDTIPADLVRLAGELGLSLQLSHYPVSDSTAGKGRGPTTT